ncbi:peptidase S53 [Pseudoduganella sp. FT93W]|uniref:Peptidase S53 n=1 Tax=Duganella fentianensis TaxID=2692177 RepID=A0A845I4A1_9BURK|nr:S53 family peptidase [Duganella fentianensis]MYN45758.1 peptidase S53 [Duganella fentianensis]
MLRPSRPVSTMLAATLAVALSGSVYADNRQNWRAVRTQTPDTSEYTEGAELRAGDTVPVAISLQLRNRAQLETFAANLMSGTGVSALSSEQFLAQYAPSSSDVASVVQHLRQSGYVNIEVSENRMLITADGTAATAGKAFNVRMAHFNRGERHAYANTNDPVVPAALGNIVLGVHGLQTVHTAHTAQVLALSTAYATAGKVGHSPTTWPAIYNASALPTAAKTSIGIITAGSVTQTLTDLYSFATSAGYARPAVSVVNARRVTNASATDNTAEWNIDSQNALGAAGGVVKSMVFYNAASMAEADLTAAFNAAVSANVAKVISVSLGECETNARASGTAAADDQIFLAGIAQGQTFVVASGDSGSYSCGGASNAQSYPASSPYVIAVGGTSLSTSSSGAWTGETVWACSTASTCASNGGTGGGASLIEAAPSWQLSAKVLGTSTRRGVPDLAFAGDPSSGAITLVKGSKLQYGGTSLAAPIFAGFWARIQSANNNKLAFPAPALYKYGAAQAALFHDVTSGSNGGYSAAKGWDYTSGFGSLNVGAFAAFVTSSGAFLAQ